MERDRGKNRTEYIYALGHDWLTLLYDPIVCWTTRESAFKPALIQQAGLSISHRVLDLGCGTGTLTLGIKKKLAEGPVAGLDGDRKILGMARNKASRAGAEVLWNCGLAHELPFADAVFDRVLSSFLFHHLTRENKRKALAEIFRVLRKGGEFHLADWGKPQNLAMRLAFFAIQLLDGFETTRDHVEGSLISYLEETRFEAVRETRRYVTLWGTLVLYRVMKP
jgi:ubiquinone/menaquinone biosynthesis C-methylase UbiE